MAAHPYPPAGPTTGGGSTMRRRVPVSVRVAIERVLGRPPTRFQATKVQVNGMSPQVTLRAGREIFHTYYVLAGNEPVLVHNCGVGNVVDELPERGEGYPTVG
ncbi:hypothetical protein Acsp01_89450 [Actinoplanes sp. NBRC 101535]|nr:hypothetical protein Acsp01_89450 [Actinoplanes sp. NBRC 101535]